MSEETLYIIRHNPHIYNFLREESYHYTYLYRDNNYIKTIDRLAKEKYKLTLSDKIERIKDKINLINTFLSVID